MKSDTLNTHLEELCERAGYTIRKERGSFRGDSCLMQGDRLIVINKSRPVDTQNMILAKILREVELEDLYIKPAVRKAIRTMWDRLDQFESEPEDS
ncbi:MAG: hypothetical protein ACQER4_00335 [Bacteroidota bacterium]